MSEKEIDLETIVNIKRSLKEYLTYIHNKKIELMDLNHIELRDIDKSLYEGISHIISQIGINSTNIEKQVDKLFEKKIKIIEKRGYK